MKVVVWTAYGDTTVYAADTPEQLARIVSLMMESMEDWGEEVMIEKVRKHLEKHSTEMDQVELAFRTIVKLAGTDQDQLESVTLTTVKSI